jgi:hypothetical protein
VTIAGVLDQVEIARAAVRRLAPLAISFDMTHLREGVSADMLVNNSALEQVRDVCGTRTPYHIVLVDEEHVVVGIRASQSLIWYTILYNSWFIVTGK